MPGYPARLARLTKVCRKSRTGAGRPTAQAHRVGEFNSVRREGQGRGYRRRILGLDVFEAEQFRECVANRTYPQIRRGCGAPSRFRVRPSSQSRSTRTANSDRTVAACLGSSPVSRRTNTLVSTEIMASQHFPADGGAHLRLAFFGFRLDRRQPATSSSRLGGNWAAGLSRIPSPVSSTVNSMPGFQSRETRIALGRMIWPLVESRVVSMVRPR